MNIKTQNKSSTIIPKIHLGGNRKPHGISPHDLVGRYPGQSSHSKAIHRDVVWPWGLCPLSSSFVQHFCRIFVFTIGSVNRNRNSTPLKNVYLQAKSYVFLEESYKLFYLIVHISIQKVRFIQSYKYSYQFFEKQNFVQKKNFYCQAELLFI